MAAAPVAASEQPAAGADAMEVEENANTDENKMEAEKRNSFLILFCCAWLSFQQVAPNRVKVALKMFNPPRGYGASLFFEYILKYVSYVHNSFSSAKKNVEDTFYIP